MSLDLGTLTAYVRADDSQYNETLDRGEGRARRFGSAVMTGMKVAGGAFLTVTSAAGALGLKTAAANEQAKISFTTMLGSGKQADKFLRDLGQFAAQTPFEFPELQTASQSLISAGVDASKVIPIMTSLGNATSGMGTGSEGVKRATVAIQQMNAAGKISMEDLNQLRDAGVPVYDLLAAATGKSVEQVAALANKGKLGRKELGQLMQALESGKGLERFNGMMEKQSTSLSGLWSTLQDTVTMGLARAVEPLVPLIKDGLGAAIAFAAGKAPQLRDVVIQIAAGARGLYDLLIGGNYSGLLRKAFGWEEDSPAVDRLFKIRDAAIGLFQIIANGDYTGHLSDAFGWEEDSPAVDKIFKIRDAAIGLYQLIVNGDYRGNLSRAFGWEEDSPAVGKILGIREAAIGMLGKVREAAAGLYQLVVSGDFSSKLATAFGWSSNTDAVTTILKIRDAVIDLFSKMSAAGGGVDLAPVGDMIGRFVSHANDVTKLGPTLGPTLNLIGDGLRFVADHADLVGKALPFLIGGFLLLKTAQTANSVMGRESAIGMTFRISSTVALTASNYALARSQRLVNATEAQSVLAQNATVASRLKGAAVATATAARTAAAWVASNTVTAGSAVAAAAVTAGSWVAASARTVAGLAAQAAAFLASRAAMLGGAAVTGVVTAAQWAWNAALSANPIGLVVIAIAALVAGLVYAWNNSETFRRVVLSAWSAIQTGVLTVVNWLREAVPAAFQWVMNAFLKYTPLGFVLSHFGQIRAFIGQAIQTVLGHVQLLASLPGKFLDWFGRAHAAAVTKATQLVTFVRGLPQRILDGLGDLGGLLLRKGEDLVGGLISGIAGMGNRLKDFVIEFVKDHIPGPIAEALGINSPSTVARDITRWVPLGAIDGLKQTGPQLRRAARDMLDLSALATPMPSLSPALAGAAPAAARSTGWVAPAVPTRGYAAAGRGPIDLSSATIAAIVAGVARVHVRAEISAGTIDRAMGAET